MAQKLFDQEAHKSELVWSALSGVHTQLAELEQQAKLIVVLHSGVDPKLKSNTTVKIESWNVGTPEDSLLNQNISRLVVQLILQGGRRTPNTMESTSTAQKPDSAKQAAQAMVRVGLESKGRGGKKVSVITGLPLSDTEFDALTTKLKRTCGTGGTHKDGQIEIQGDHRDKLMAELQKLGYKPKRTGG